MSAASLLQGSSKESKGKRMAMKLMNKIGSKEKFVKNVPGLGRLTHSQDAEVGRARLLWLEQVAAAAPEQVSHRPASKCLAAAT